MLQAILDLVSRMEREARRKREAEAGARLAALQPLPAPGAQRPPHTSG